MFRVREQIACPEIIPKNETEISVKVTQPQNGEGITVAVLDTGMAMHPDLTDNLLAFKDFVNNRHNA